MNTHTTCRTFGIAVAGLTLAGWVVPAPAGDPKENAPAAGGIAAALRMRDKLPRSGAPTPSAVALKGGTVELMRVVLEYRAVEQQVTANVVEQVPYQETVEVKVDGRIEKRAVVSYRPVTRQVVRKVTAYQPELRTVKQAVPVK